MPNTYPIKYKVEINGPYTKEQLSETDSGGCDLLGIISVMGGFRNGEELSVIPMGIRPDGTSWDDIAWFEIVGMLTSNLKDSPQLDAKERTIMQDTFERIRAMKVNPQKAHQDNG